MNKKANILLDVGLIAVMLFALAIAIPYASDTTKDMTQTVIDDPDVTQSGRDYAQTIQDRVDPTADGWFVAILITFWIGACVSSFFIDTHPVFFIIFIVGLIALMIVCIYLANDFAEQFNENYDETKDRFPITFFVMEHYIVTILIMAASVAFCLWGKLR